MHTLWGTCRLRSARWTKGIVGGPGAARGRADAAHPGRHARVLAARERQGRGARGGARPGQVDAADGGAAPTDRGAQEHHAECAHRGQAAAPPLGSDAHGASHRQPAVQRDQVFRSWWARGGLLDARSERALLQVSDRGQGIAESEIALLFKPFQTTSSRPTAGEPSTGLGLAIVRKLVEANGGQITVRSSLHEGSTFTVHFPVARSSATQLVETGAPRPPRLLGKRPRPNRGQS